MLYATLSVHGPLSPDVSLPQDYALRDHGDV